MSFLSLQCLFEQQVEQTPDAIAVVAPTITLTYRELNERANRLSHALIQQHVGPETLVGIYVSRCPELVVALLAVLKAGAAYLPLDPDYPAARTSFMLTDAGARIVLTQDSLVNTLSPTDTRIICIDESLTALDESVPNPLPRSGPDSLAYLMYTSGSTGQPKGILITQRGLMNYLNWCLTAYPVDAGSGSPVHSSIAFDLTVTTLYLPLLAGLSVYLLPQGNALDSLRGAFRAGLEFSFVMMTPAHLELLSQVLEHDEITSRTHAMIVGGEQLSYRQLAFWREVYPDACFFNAYGPTETVVGCTAYEIPRETRLTGAVPIGKAIANTTLFIVDPSGRMTPPGESGELLIGGHGVARGYHNLPALTAERFVPDALSGVPGARLYRSGDLVRSLPTGDLEFLGRMDRQIKIRGYRIESGEVEETIRTHPSVLRSLVVTRDETPSDTTLVSYVVPRSGQAITGDDLRGFLQNRLPSYMIPSDFLFLDSLPINVNGKVDQSALPWPGGRPVVQPVKDSSRREGDQEDNLASMVGLWEEVFRTTPIQKDDSFFELGGDSLKAVRLVSRIRSAFGCDLPLSSLVEAPTPRLLMGLLGRPRRQNTVALVTVRSSGTRPPFFCLTGAGGDVFYLADLAHELGNDQPFHGIHWHYEPDSDNTLENVEAYASRALALIRSTQPHGPYFLGGFSFGGIVAYELAQQLLAQGESVAMLAVIDQPIPLAIRSLLSPKCWWQVLKNLPLWLRHDLLRHRPAYIVNWLRERLIKQLPLRSEGQHQAEEELLPETMPLTLFEYYQRLEHNYCPRPLDTHLTLLRSSSQKHQPILQALLSGKDLGWSRLARGGVDVIVVPGWHESILKKPLVKRLASSLRERLIMAAVCASPRHNEGIAQYRISTENFQQALSEDRGRWQVVMNDKRQYSLLPVEREIPAGWQVVGACGSREECLSYIRATWTDLSVRANPGAGCSG